MSEILPQVTAEEVRADASILAETQKPAQIKPVKKVSMTPRESYEMANGEGRDLPHEFNSMQMFAGSVMRDTNIEDRASMYHRQKLKPLEDVERAQEMALETLRQSAIDEFNKKPKPTFQENINAMWHLENPIGGALLRVNIPQLPPMAGYNPMDDDIENYWPIADQISKSVHPAQTEVMKQNYDFEKQQKEILMRSSTPLNLITGMSVGIADPQTWAFMGASIPSKVMKAGMAAKFSYGVGLTTTGQAINEVILHNQQQLRTIDETALNVLSSALLTGAIGGSFVATRQLKTADYAGAKTAIQDYFRAGKPKADVDDGLTDLSVGAAQVFKEDISLVKFDKKQNPIRWAIGAIPFYMSKIATPLGKGLNATSNKARTTTAELAETNIDLTGSTGIVSTETLVKVDYRRANVAKLDVYKMEAQAKEQFGMSREEFANQLDFAQRRNDSHENPIVQQAAQRLRKVSDDLWDQAFEQRIKGTYTESRDASGNITYEKVKPDTALSYQTRVYDHKLIDNDYTGFHTAVKEGAVDARLRENTRAQESVNKYIANQAQQLKEQGPEFLVEAKLFKDAKADLNTKAYTAIKGNKEYIGRLKEKGKDNPKIDELNDLVKKLEKEIKARKVEIKKIDDSMKAARKFQSEYKAKLKELKAKIKEPYLDYELDAYANSYYQGVMNLKEGDTHFDVGGADILKSRINIRDKYLEPYLEKNWEKRLDHHAKTLAPRTRLAEKFGNQDGDFEMKSRITEIHEDYTGRIQDLKEDGEIKAANKLQREMNSQIDNVKYLRDTLLNRVFSEDRNSLGQSMGRTLLNFNASRMLNGMMISSIPEMAKLMAKHGIKNFNTALIKGAKSWRIKDLPKEEGMRIASSVYRAMGTRTSQMSDVYDITPTTALETASKKLAHMTTYWSGQQGFDSLFKSIAGALSSDGFARAARAGDTKALLKAGFNDSQVTIIQREIKKHGREVGGLWEPRVEAWDLRLKGYNGNPRQLKDIYDAIIVKDADSLIVQPSIGDKPRFMTSMTGRIIFQFKSFIMGATNKTLVPLVQGSNVNMFKNLAYMNSLSLMGYIAYETGVGRDIDWSDTDKIVNEMMNRGGYLGYATELMQIYRLHAGNSVASRYRSRSGLGAMLGPSFGTIEDMRKAISLQTDENGEFLTDADARLHALRKLLPFQNHWLIRQGLDQAEGSAARALGGTGRFAEPAQARPN